jgi:hypothetical protein
MAYVDQSSAFGFGTKLTSTQMQNLRDNLDAAFAKDSGAPVLANDYVVNAMVDSASIENRNLVANDIGFDKMDFSIISQGTISLNSGDTFTLTDGAWNIISSDTNLRLELFVDGSWRTSGENPNGAIFGDGSNMRLNKIGGGLIAYYFQLFQ